MLGISNYNSVVPPPICIIDADLLDNGTRFPNLALMKISGYYKEKGLAVSLLETYQGFDPSDYGTVFISKVFDFTIVPDGILGHENVHPGGTGFYFNKAPALPPEIEHHMPDYHLYDSYVAKQKPGKQWMYYEKCSIGFATRGCFRQCPFCVNQDSKKVEFHSHIKEWVDPDRKIIVLLDDNLFGYSKWAEVFNELKETGKPFVFRQGLDIRLLTEEKAKMLGDVNYYGDFIFAFDNVEDAPIIEKKLALWRKYVPTHRTKLYVLCGFVGLEGEEIDGVFQRIDLLSRYDCIPYIMRHENYQKSKYKGMFIVLARWCNQVSFLRKKSFREFVNLNQEAIKTPGKLCASMRYMLEFERDYPEIASKWFDKKFYE